MKKKYIIICLSMFLIIFLIIVGCDNSANQPTVIPKEPAPNGWTEYNSNPVIK